ncbi:glycoside hydrolase family 43 protein [Parasphingorhabdus pacifica]
MSIFVNRPGWNRRQLLRTGALLGAGVALGGASAVSAQGSPRSTNPVHNPLIRQRADPFITRHGGRYHFTASVPEYDRLIIRSARTLAGLGSAEEVTVWRRPESGAMAGHVWAPELHRIEGRWYVYFAAGDSEDPFRMRMFVLENRATDPREGEWRALGRIDTPLDTFALDATTFAHRGRRYLCWAQTDPGMETKSNLYIGEMTSPAAITGRPVRISAPTHDWEMRGFRVNEGPAVLARNGRVFLSYSASATDANYCMGLLTASAGANLLDPGSWSKNPAPVFMSNAENSQYGPGHNSFTVSEDGETDVLVYHARPYEEIDGDPLFDPNRHTRVQQVGYHEDGTPDFGVPVADGPLRG